MAITAGVFGAMFAAAFNKEIDLLDDAIHATLHTSTYTPAQDTDDYYNDATNELATAGGYTAGGQALAGKTFNYTAGTNVRTFDANDVQWTSTTLTWRHLILHDRTPATDATRPLILFQSSDTNIVSTGGNTDIVWHANGVFTITVAAP